MSEVRLSESTSRKKNKRRHAEDEIFDLWGLGIVPNKQKQKVPPPGGIFLFWAFLIRKALLAKEEFTL